MIKYFVNKEKGTVVAIFTTEDDKSQKVIWKCNLLNHLNSFLANVCFLQDLDDRAIIVDKVLEDRRLFGKAKLADGDVFNEKVGKELARKDLINRYKLAEVMVDRLVLDQTTKSLSILKSRVD